MLFDSSATFSSDWTLVFTLILASKSHCSTKTFAFLYQTETRYSIIESLTLSISTFVDIQIFNHHVNSSLNCAFLKNKYRETNNKSNHNQTR